MYIVRKKKERYRQIEKEKDIDREKERYKNIEKKIQIDIRQIEETVLTQIQCDE